MRKLNEKRIQSMSGYLNRRYDQLWKEGAAHEDRKDGYEGKCEAMRVSTMWLSARRKEFNGSQIDSYAGTMQRVLDRDEHSDEYKAGWNAGVVEAENFMRWAVEFSAISLE